MRATNRKGKSVGLPALVSIVVLAAVAVLVLYGPADVRSTDGRERAEWEPEISAIGAIARGDVPRPDADDILKSRHIGSAAGASLGFQGNDQIVNSPTAAGFQSGNSIAKAGNQMVVGYNDERGYALPAVSISGYAYSVDAGQTWTDGGQLPTAGANDEVFGLGDVKVWTNPNTSQRRFFYSSLYKTSTGANSLCIHTSTDGGVTWLGPRVVTSATSVTDFPDKPFMSVDPETGRLFVSWTNFGATITMRVSYSDDAGGSWSTPQVFNSIGQGSIPRADGSSDNVYLAWHSIGTIQFVASTDNGLTWDNPRTVAANALDPVVPYGFDRVNGFPSMDIDYSNGNIYIVYASKSTPQDFGDIYFTRSVDQGANFDTPVAINARQPANDRAQCFPWVTVDRITQRVTVVWYDQVNGSESSDLTDVFHTHSENQGVDWSCQSALTDHSFYAEYGNTESRPNLGDYIQAVSESNTIYTAFAKTDEPSYLTYAPDTYIDISTGIGPVAPIGFVQTFIEDEGCTSRNGFMEPGERVELQVEIKLLSNCVNFISNIRGTLTTTNPHITITHSQVDFENLPTSGGVARNRQDPFLMEINEGPIVEHLAEFMLSLTTSDGPVTLVFTMNVGNGAETMLLNENFNLVSPPNLPAGWTATNEAGTVNLWETSNQVSSSFPTSAFCADIATTSLNRLASPPITVPADADLVDITFNITYELENDDERMAWDGCLLRVEIDDGVTTEVRLAGSFASMFDPFYQSQANRQDPAEQPIQNLACWSGFVLPVFRIPHLQFPGLAGKTVRFFWDVGTDAQIGTPTGVFIDDVIVKSIDFREGDCDDLVFDPPTQVFENVVIGVTTCDTVLVINQSDFSTVVIDSIWTDCDDPPYEIFTDMLDLVLPAGDTTFVVVCVTPDGSVPDACGFSLRSSAPNGISTLPITLGFVLTGIGDDPLPQPFDQLTVVPNPFNPTTTVRFTLAQRMPVTAEVWSVSGARVQTLASGREFAAGLNELTWDGRNESGAAVATGVYFIRVKTPQGERVARAVLLK